MRTTVSLDSDVADLVKRAMEERGIPFKVALNDAVRAGLTRRARRGSFETPTFQMGQPLVPLDKALRIDSELEDEELIQRLARRT